MSSTNRIQSCLNLLGFPSDIENHLNVLKDASTGVSTAPETEILNSLKQIHTKQEIYFLTISSKIQFLNFEVMNLVEDETNGAKSLFYFIDQNRIQETKVKIEQLIIFAVTYLTVCSHPTPKQKLDNLSLEEEAIKKNVSDGSKNKNYYLNFMEVVPVYEEEIINRNLMDQSEFEVFQSVYKKYIEEVNEVVFSSSFKMKSLMDKYLAPIVNALNRAPCSDSTKLSYTEAGATEKDIWMILFSSTKWIMEILSGQFLVNKVSIEENYNLLSRDETRNHIISFETKNNFVKMDYDNSYSSPDGAFQTAIIGSKELLHLGSNNFEKEKINESMVQVIVTLFPIEIKKELFKAKTLINTERFPVLDNEIVLDLKEGFSEVQLKDMPNFLHILQQDIRYIVGSSKILQNTCIFIFVHRSALHVGRLVIDLDKLTFIDHPKVEGRKLLKLQESGKRKVIPVQFKAYPLERLENEVIDTNISLKNHAMVKLISWIHSLSETVNSVEKMKEVHLKLSSLRDTMRLDAPEIDTTQEPNDQDNVDEDIDGCGDAGDHEGLEHDEDSDCYQMDKDDDDEGYAFDPRNTDSPDKQFYEIEESDVDSNSCFNTGEINANLPDKSSDPTSGSSDISFIRIDKLVLPLRTPKDDVFHYVTNTAIVKDEEGKERITSIRAFHLKKKFGIKFLEDCYERQFFSNILYMPLKTLLQSLETAIRNTNEQVKNGHLEELIANAKNWKIDQLFIKYYSPINVFRYFFQDLIEGKKCLEDDYFDDFEKEVYDDCYINESKWLQKITAYNNSMDILNTPSKKIVIPTFLMMIDDLNFQYGKYGDAEDMGPCIITECLDFAGWSMYAPLSQNQIDDACSQINVLIRVLRIRYNNIQWDNLSFTRDHRVCFTDFSSSEDLSESSECDLDRIVEEDQWSLKVLLRCEYGG